MKTFAIALIAVTTTAFTLNDLGSAANRLRLNVQNAVASAVARADALHDEFMENFWEMQDAIQDRFESITETQYERAVEFSNMISEKLVDHLFDGEDPTFIGVAEFMAANIDNFKEILEDVAAIINCDNRMECSAELVDLAVSFCDLTDDTFEQACHVADMLDAATAPAEAAQAVSSMLNSDAATN